ncbi:FAD-dependent oxidoreductase [Tepidibacter aestuarii]|uniref:FAD-dependent oxidoreductase n=1 Tax=Tepidibacter aestuarii TaxID=2925782 RepID=UPI0020C10E66|nr:FAD-dependent oxidoreductase [Tepidibacter aestuarii]CAH2213464.1 Cinnamate reductase [Tepidibacter aestuarii]
MKTKFNKIFEPITIGRMTIKNRTSMAPMGLVCYSDANGGFNDEAQNYYIERAKGGVGLIVTGICCVNYDELPEQALPCPTHNPLMFCKSTAQMVEKIHAHDAKIFLQLTGGLGRSAMPAFIKKAVAPSENSNRFDPSISHREMTKEEIEKLIQDFIQSAAIAQKSGFDGVEIHAVHEGYLLDQFALSIFNKRTDEYGGDLHGRLKVATDIVKGIKAVCGADFPVSLRFSVKSFMKGIRQGALPGEEFIEVGKDYDEGIESAKILVDAGYDILNVDAGTYDSWYWNHPPMYFEKGMYREFGRIVKKAVDVPVILAGRMDDPEIAIDALNGCCDIVSYGRPLLADAHLVNKIKTNNLEDIRPCLSCHDGCMGRIAHGLPLSCAVNPACGREVKYGLTPAAEKKNILIVGGGVAGLESARVCAARGHKVELVEASGQLGGNIIPGGVPDFKEDDHALIKWYENQLAKLGVAVKKNTKVDRAYIENSDADAVITATGSKPIKPNFGDKNHICTANDVLNGECEFGEKIAVVGGGLVGCETALWLAQKGKNVCIVEMMPDIAGGPHGIPFMNYDMLKDLLAANDNIDVYCNTKLMQVNDNSVILEDENGTKEVEVDTVITAIGYRSENTLQKELQDIAIPVYNIGDSREVKNIMNAIWDAYEVAKNI